MVVSVSLLLAAPGAFGQTPEPVVSQNVPLIAEHLARGGAADVPGVGCGSSCSQWWLQEHQPIPNQPSSQALHAELRAARSTATKVLPRLGTLTTIGLVVGTAELSWKIGTGIRTKILKVGLPDPPQPKASPASGTLAFQNAGYTSSFNNTPLPADGWLLRWWYGSSQWSAVNLSHGWGHACAYLTGPPQDFRVLPGYATVGWCENPPVPVESYWLTENELEAVAPVQDYVDQPFDKQTFNWDGKPASREELESRTRAALESGDYPRAEAWWAERLDPRNHDTATDDDEACALGDGGTGADPGLERGSGETGEEFLRRYQQVPGAVYPAAGLPSINGAVYMRWGFTTPNVDNSHIEWRGWGYRKIQAKHGWGSDDLEATRVALLDPTPELDPTIAGRYRYVGPEYPGRSEARCQRVVVVEYERNQEEIQADAPAPAGIVTSFGRRIG